MHILHTFYFNQFLVVILIIAIVQCSMLTSMMHRSPNRSEQHTRNDDRRKILSVLTHVCVSTRVCVWNACSQQRRSIPIVAAVTVCPKWCTDSKQRWTKKCTWEGCDTCPNCPRPGESLLHNDKWSPGKSNHYCCCSVHARVAILFF